MKISILFVFVFIIGFTNAQTIRYSENFEGSTFNVTSSGSSVWDTTSIYQSQGNTSIHTSITASNDTTILTTNSFSTSGDNYVMLRFDHIAKLHLFDGGYIEVSANNGSTWTRLTNIQYKGNADYFGITPNNQFNAASYPSLWNPVIDSLIPQNTWWRSEIFDISLLIGNVTQAKVRFVLHGNNTATYGWMLDDIEITSSTSELVPPTISLIQPYPTDTVFTTGPFDVYASISDASGIESASLIYSISGVDDTLPMNFVSFNIYKATIPSQPYQTEVCYRIVAIDSSANSNQGNYPINSCVFFIVKRDPSLPTPFQYDAATYSIESPIQQNPSNVSTPITIRISNKGDSTLNKAQIGWVLDGVTQQSFTWTGSLSLDQVSDTFSIGSASFQAGLHDIEFWTYSPNDSVDENNSNDTMQFSFYVCDAVLNGTYTLGGPTADFQNFNELILGLNNCGMNGNVTITVNPGIYNEQIKLSNAIPGLDSINTLTIKSASTNINDVHIKYAPSNSNDFVLGLDGVNFVTFEGMTIESLIPSISTIKIYNEASNNTINNCKIISVNGPNSNTHGVNIIGINSNYNTINSNSVVGGSSGIRLYGVNSAPQIGNSIHNNIVHYGYMNGIEVYYQQEVSIKGNTITRPYNSIAQSYITGIRLLIIKDYEVLENNININLNSSGYGISLGQATTSGLGGYGYIFNNMIAINGSSTSSTAMGIYYMHNTNSKLYNNSISLNTGGSFATAVSIGGTTTVDIINNSIANFNGGYAFTNSSSNIGSVDYNNYYSSGVNIAKWGSSTAQTSNGINGIKAVSNLDTNSLVSDPKYYSTTNIHSHSSIMDAAGKVLSEITNDIDGDVRNPNSPDIGADEFTISTVDIGIIDILNVLPIDTQSRIVNLVASIKNYGSQTVTSCNVKYSLNGSSPITVPWAGSIASGGTDTVNLGNISLPVLDFNIIASTVKATDTLNLNDSLIRYYHALPLIDAEMVSLVNPQDGCEKGANETIEVKIKNQGLRPINNGLSASYTINGSSTTVTENILDTIPVGGEIVYSFTQKVDMTTGFQDSIFNFYLEVHHTSDPIISNDTTIGAVVSQGELLPPQVFDTSVFYGNSITLTANSNDPIFWYNNDSTAASFSNGSTYTTPLLFDTTTYYVQASQLNPPSSANIGFATTEAGAFDVTIYGRTQGQGKYQILYTAAELLASGLTAGELESIEFHVGFTYSNFSLTNMSISMANVSNSSLTSSFITTSLTPVYNAPFMGTTQIDKWYTHTFTSPFFWDGTSNLLIQVCTQGNVYNAPAQKYTTTSFNSFVVTQGGTVTCADGSGTISNKRPNIKIHRKGSFGCSSARVPVTVDVPLPTIDANLSELIEPKSGCGLISTPVTISIVNNGTDTIPSGINATYKVDNGSYITPESVPSAIAPADTLLYTFNTLASLSPGTNGTDYMITSKIITPNDNYIGNDSVIEDSITSNYTPSNPVTTNLNTVYSNTASLNATHVDSLFWYSDSLGTQLLGMGNGLITDPLFDTTIFYAQEQQTIPATNYQVGAGNSNTGSSGPSPYGAGDFGSKNQILIMASELSALGMIQGPIHSISFNVSTSAAIPMSNYSISIGHTSRNSMLGSYLETGLTEVFSVSNYVETTGWNEHQFSTPFFWDGYSNIIIESCFKNAGNTAFSSVKYTGTPYTSVAAMIGGSNFNCNDSAITSNSINRPNVRLNQTGMATCGSDLIPLTVNITNYPTIDAGLLELVEPSGAVSSTSPSNIKVILKNFGLTTMTNATIKWKEKDVSQTTYNWIGSLAYNETDTVTLSTNHLFKGGDTKLKIWVELTNDNTPINDTIADSLLICMSGTYTINKNSGDYHSFSDAINDLDLVGICGPVVFNIDSGQYVEQLTLSPINGSSPTNTITFQSSQLDSTKVNLTNSPTLANNYIVKFQGVSNIKFKHLTIQSLGGQYGNCIVLENGASNLEFNNNIIISTNTALSTSKASGIYSNSVGISDITISNNRFLYGYNVIQFQGSSSNRISNIEILNNSFNSFNGNGIHMTYNDSLEISENSITSSSTGSNSKGIYFVIVENFKITKNKIVVGSTTDNAGMYIRGKGSNANHSLIANNFISIVGGSGINEGIKLTFSEYIDVYYNSIDISVGNTSSKAFYLSSSTNTNVKNNTFASIIGYAIYSSTVISSLQVDYNNYYTNNSTSQSFAYWGAQASDLIALKAIDPNNNQNSLETNPAYISPIDLHSQQVDLYNTGLPIIGITTDIDGDLRNTINPSIGADEFTPPTIDLSIPSMAHPAVSDCGFTSTDSLVVIVKNAGLNSLNFATTNATITVIISGIITDTVIYILNNGTVTSGNSLNVTVANNYDLSLNGEYIINASVNILNDGNPLNDAMSTLNIMSYPNINSFPFSENFESEANTSFKEESSLNSKLTVSSAAAYQSGFGLHFEGGGSGSWNNPTTVTQAFSNTEHISSATTCNIDLTNVSSLYFQFNLKQTKYTDYSSGNYASWFRVMLIDANNVSHYLKTIDGDSVFLPKSANLDTAKLRTYDLSAFVGQNIQIKMEAACFRNFTYGSFSGDNAFVDNIEIWEPSAVDVAIKSVWSDQLFGQIGSDIKVNTLFTNFGIDTLYSIPLAYRVGSGMVIRDTTYGVYPPFASDSFAFTIDHSLGSGIEKLCVFSEHPLDGTAANDTSCVAINGLNTFIASYSTDFESNNDWFNAGVTNQWEKGMPNTIFIDTTYSGTNAWATVLSGNHITGKTEYLYSPYFIIPTYADTAQLEFFMTMNVFIPNAYGLLEVSYNGTTWGSIGYIGDPNSSNWYNQALNGKHVWSYSNYAWAKSSIKLDPTNFNTGQPFQIRFSFNGGTNPVSFDGWAIDDFKITIPPQSTDVGISSIVNPHVSTIVGDSISVKVIVQNFGTDTITTIPLEYTIDGAIIGSEIWNGVLYYNQIDTFTFATKYHTGGSDYHLCSYTTLTGDLINQNDTSCSMIVTSPGKHDAGISQLIAPSNHTSIGMPTTVKVIIQNYGTEELSAIPIEYLLNGNSKATEIFNDTIAGGDSAEYIFTTTYISPAGNYGICAQTNLLGDVNPDNDQQCEAITGTAIEPSLNSQFVVKQNIPNPSNTSSSIDFFIPKSGKVQLKVMNTFGAVIFNSEKTYYSGKNNIILNTASYESGIYYYSVTYEGISKSFKIIVMH